MAKTKKNIKSKTTKNSPVAIKSSKSVTKGAKKTIKSSQCAIKSNVKKTTKLATDAVKPAPKTALLAKPLQIIKRSFVGIFGVLGATIKDHQSRRPHRSFRHTPRKIHQRPLQIEGYFKFSSVVLRQIWQEKKFFLTLLLASVLSGVLLSGIMPHTTYNNLKSVMDQTYKTDDNLGSAFYKSGLLLISAATDGGFNPLNTEAKQILIILVVMMVWLSTIWYLRHRMAHQKVKFRDAVYNAGAPLVSTFLIVVYMTIQAIPLMLFIIFYAAAVSTDFASTGAAAMMVHGIAFLVTVLSIYWLEGSFLALVIVTLPGMYPGKALSIAGDLVLGRRLKIILRILWHCFQVVSFWVILGVPVVYIDRQFFSNIGVLRQLPIVPIFVAFMSMASAIWTNVYIYMLYRRIVEDESQPA